MYDSCLVLLVGEIFHVLCLPSSSHNFFTDYVCNQADLEIIELIKKTLINLERNKLCSSMMLS